MQLIKALKTIKKSQKGGKYQQIKSKPCKNEKNDRLTTLKTFSEKLELYL